MPLGDASRNDADGQVGASPARRWIGRLSFWIGCVLLIAAIVFAWRRRYVLGEAWSALRDPDPLLVGVLICATCLNLAISALVLSVLIRRYGRVGLLEMQGLTAATALVNYLPMRPGLLGRIAYHHHVNQIRPVHTLATAIAASIISVIAAGWLALAVWCSGAARSDAAGAAVQSGTALLWWVCVPIVVLAVLVLPRRTRVWAVATLLRYAEMFTWAARYWAAFGLLGQPIGAGTAVALACVGVIATMVPLVSNGLGVREWAVGALSPYLAMGAEAATMPFGIAAELVNRAAELVVVVIAGSVGSVYLAARQRGIQAARH